MNNNTNIEVVYKQFMDKLFQLGMIEIIESNNTSGISAEDFGLLITKILNKGVEEIKQGRLMDDPISQIDYILSLGKYDNCFIIDQLLGKLETGLIKQYGVAIS